MGAWASAYQISPNADGLPNALAERLQRLGRILERIAPRHMAGPYLASGAVSGGSHPPELVPARAKDRADRSTTF